jgi:hypothetical protein
MAAGLSRLRHPETELASDAMTPANIRFASVRHEETRHAKLSILG